MEVVTSYYLLELIFYDISGSVKQHRKSKGREYLYKHSAWPMPEEIDDFIRSTPYYSERLKEFLLGDPNKSILIGSDWLNCFYEKTTLWADSEEWLYFGPPFISEPSLNQQADRLPLELP